MFTFLNTCFYSVTWCLVMKTGPPGPVIESTWNDPVFCLTVAVGALTALPEISDPVHGTLTTPDPVTPNPGSRAALTPTTTAEPPLQPFCSNRQSIHKDTTVPTFRGMVHKCLVELTSGTRRPGRLPSTTLT